MEGAREERERAAFSSSAADSKREILAKERREKREQERERRGNWRRSPPSVSPPLVAWNPTTRSCRVPADLELFSHAILLTNDCREY